MAEFTRFAETITVKEDMRVVSITVQPIVSDCTGRIWFTDLMLQEGDRLTGFVINTETLLQKYREDDAVVAPRFSSILAARPLALISKWSRFRIWPLAVL